jgi:hypothetical protein
MKAPDVDIRAAVSRAIILIIVILISILLSVATAEAGVKNERKPFNRSVQKRKNQTYSCEALMEKRKGSSNIVVKKSRRPKWR